MQSQIKKVSAHLEKAPITQMEAAEKYNIWRLAAIIFKLRRDGDDIVTDLVESKNGHHYGRYWLRTGRTCQCPECDTLFDAGQALYRTTNDYGDLIVECPCCKKMFNADAAEQNADNDEWCYVDSMMQDRFEEMPRFLGKEK